MELNQEVIKAVINFPSDEHSHLRQGVRKLRSYFYDLSPVSSMSKWHGAPDIDAEFSFEDINNSNKIVLKTKLHSIILTITKSPVLIKWVQTAPLIAKEFRLKQKIPAHPHHFELFLEFLYHEQMSAETIGPILEVAQILSVPISRQLFTSCLTLSNAKKIVEILKNGQRSKEKSGKTNKIFDEFLEIANEKVKEEEKAL